MIVPVAGGRGRIFPRFPDWPGKSGFLLPPGSQEHEFRIKVSGWFDWLGMGGVAQMIVKALMLMNVEQNFSPGEPVNNAQLIVSL